MLLQGFISPVHFVVVMDNTSNPRLVSVYLGTTINKHQIMQQKTNYIRTAFILFPGHLK